MLMMQASQCVNKVGRIMCNPNTTTTIIVYKGAGQGRRREHYACEHERGQGTMSGCMSPESKSHLNS